MRLPYFLARASLAWVFIDSGVDVLRHPEGRAKLARPVLDRTRALSPIALPHDQSLVRANALAQVAAGGALALGLRPRLSATVLMGSLVPTTWAGHAFWAARDDEERSGQRYHFNKNVGLLGGLLLVLLTGAKPGHRRAGPTPS